MQGAIAAGHELTAEAAIHIFEAGGNAFDAALAALCTANVVEPVLTSLGGGGFFLAREATGATSLFDFFVQTPLQKKNRSALDFKPILADFGTAQQEFHIGIGSIATPGTIRGLFDVHRSLGSLPMKIIMEPAIHHARTGFQISPMQGYLFSVVAPIYIFSETARSIYKTGSAGNGLPESGDLFVQPQLADTLEQLVLESERLFYEGELGRQLIEQCATSGGHLTADDLEQYRTLRRDPLQYDYRDWRLFSNPPPSSGGILIRFAMELLSDHSLSAMGFGGKPHLGLLSHTMEQTNLARGKQGEDADPCNNELLERYRLAVQHHLQNTRGTTHISVVDERGNAAALSLSNGEGCGHMLGGSGIMPNNMLGEEDLSPNGLHQWRTDSRVSSMMAPTLAINRDRMIITGSGGSNRLRTAILQTLSNIIDFGMPVEAAVHAPRIHSERGRISIEPGFEQAAIDPLIGSHREHHLWEALNLFFGGAHTLSRDSLGLSGSGDPRRGGVFRSTTK